MQKSKKFLHKILNKIDKVDHCDLEKLIIDLNERNDLLEFILDRLSDGILLVREDGSIHFRNEGSKRYLENSSNKKKLSLGDFVKSEVKDHLMNEIEDYEGNYLHTSYLSTHQFLHLQVGLSKIQFQEQFLFLIVISDQTNAVNPKVQAEKRVHFETLLRLAAGIAHEIGNPLNSMEIHLQLLKRKLEEDASEEGKKKLEHLEIISSETRRLDKIVKDFLKATRQAPLRYQLNNLPQIIENALSVMKPAFDENKVSYELKVKGKLNDFYFDRDRIYQMVLNLLKNANEAMPDGGKIFIKLSNLNKVVTLEVHDEGMGISEEDQAKIFDAYYSTKPDGSGLGLLFVYNTMMEHGGRIEVDSKLGHGTKFYLHIPMHSEKLQLTSDQE